MPPILNRPQLEPLISLNTAAPLRTLQITINSGTCLTHTKALLVHFCTETSISPRATPMDRLLAIEDAGVTTRVSSSTTTRPQRASPATP